jgi:hypothetical protein
MHTYGDLNRDRFRAVQSAATAAPVDGVAFRTLVCMLATVDTQHFILHGEMLTFVSLDVLEATTLVSKSTVAKARRRLAAMGMIVRLTDPSLRGRPVVYRINTEPHVPLPFPDKMRQALANKNRIADLRARPSYAGRAEQRAAKQPMLDAIYNAIAFLEDERERQAPGEGPL